MSDESKTTSPRTKRLRRDLSVWGAIGLSLALLAPSMAANLTPQATSAAIGRAVPLAFVVAAVGVLLVGWTFVRLTQRFHHAGSVYGFVGVTLGPRAGLVSGWALLGVYVVFAMITTTASGIFIAALLDETNIWPRPPIWAVYTFAGLVLLPLWTLAARPVRSGARTVLVIEAVTVALILIVSIIVAVQLLTGKGAHGHRLEPGAFTVAPGTGISSVFLGAVYGFLAFAGFEASATLGGETQDPRRAIPRAILGTALFASVFFIFVTWIEVSAFGIDNAGLGAFTSSGSLIGDISRTYIADWLGAVITAGVAVSAFGSALASITGAARLVFAFAHDGIFPSRLAVIDDRREVPTRATTTVVIAVAVIGVILAAVVRLAPFEVFADGGAVGVLILLAVYALATIGATRLVLGPGPPPRREVARWEIAVPVLGLAVLAYTLYRNVIPYPSGPAAWFPILATLWVLAGVAWAFLRPAVAARAGRALAADEGLKLTPSDVKESERPT